MLRDPFAIMPSSIVGRLAPSPTGAQHVGNARTYLIAWLSARSQGGQVVLRIEDLDSPRVKAGAAEEAMDDLHWLGLDWDGPPARANRAVGHLRRGARQAPEARTRLSVHMHKNGYRAQRPAPHLEHEGPAYPGTCAGQRAHDAAALTLPFAWRMRVGTQDCTFDDLVRGSTKVNLHEVGGDFVVWKTAGTPAYQLAVVVDDAAQGVTEVIRGDDLIPSTPRQLLLYDVLGLAPPRFGHVPLVVGPDGRRLAKRHGRYPVIRPPRSGCSRRRPGRPVRLVLRLARAHRADRSAPIDSTLFLARLARLPFVLTADLLRQIGFRG